jgi:hypothetical protein
MVLPQGQAGGVNGAEGIFWSDSIPGIPLFIFSLLHKILVGKK